jgi:hypothetical protein
MKKLGVARRNSPSRRFASRSVCNGLEEVLEISLVIPSIGGHHLLNHHYGTKESHPLHSTQGTRNLALTTRFATP